MFKPAFSVSSSTFSFRRFFIVLAFFCHSLQDLWQLLEHYHHLLSAHVCTIDHIVIGIRQIKLFSNKISSLYSALKKVSL